MKKEHEIILNTLRDYLTIYPEIRFGQALFNLNINQFEEQRIRNILSNEVSVFELSCLRDIHFDTDKQIVERLNKNYENNKRT